MNGLHIFCEEDGEVTAYLRAFFKVADTVQMGRVLTRHHGTGLGGYLLKEGISQIRTKMNPAKIYIEAQCYAVGFYGTGRLPDLLRGIPGRRDTPCADGLTIKWQLKQERTNQ